MSNYTYMVTNNINGKVYVGSHSWKGEGLDPNYYGSGTAITRAVKKYGKDNFQVEVLYYYNTVEECRADEERILTEYDVKNCPHSYNCKNSAIGFTSEDMKGKTVSDETRQKLSQALKGENNPLYGKRGKDTPMYGRHHTEEAKRKMSQAKKNVMTPIVAIQIDTGKIRVFESIIECARQLNSNPGHIYNCLKGRQKTCKGYIIKYIEQLESGIYEGITEGIAE